MSLPTDVKKKVAVACVQASLPLAQMGLRHYYDSKLINQQMEHEVTLAEKRANGIARLDGPIGGAKEAATEEAVDAAAQQGAQQASSPVSNRVPHAADPYRELEDLQERTDCGFCAQAAAGLQDAPKEEAFQGLRELQEYQNELDRLRNNDVSRQQAEAVVDDLVSGWQVVPKYLAPGGQAQQPAGQSVHEQGQTSPEDAQPQEVTHGR